MQHKPPLLLALCLILIALPALRLAEKPLSADEAWRRGRDGDLVEVEGRLRLVGNEPFTELSLQDAGGHDWYIDTKSRSALEGMQQQTITLRGRLKVEPRILADGTVLESRRVLQDVELISE